MTTPLFNNQLSFIILLGGLVPTNGIAQQSDELAVNCNGIPMAIEVDVQAPGCYGDDNGSISITISGGTPSTMQQDNDPGINYTIDWNKNGFDGMSAIENVPAGSYNLTVTDSLGCQIQTVVNVPQPEEMVITHEVIQPTTNSLGSIDISVSGGIGAYSYIWSNGDNSEDVLGLTSGNYNVVVYDQNNCAAEKSIALRRYQILDENYVSQILPSATESMRTFISVQMLISPNPVYGTATIQWNNDEANELLIVDRYGVIVFQQKLKGETEVQVENLNSGVYKVVLNSPFFPSISETMIVQ